MKWLVDANVLSEPTRADPNPRVVEWLARHEPDLAVDPFVLGEVRYGILLLPKGKRRARLEQWFDGGVSKIRCLPWDAVCGLRWAALLADLRAAGQAMAIKNSLVATTALVHGLTVATRNVRDFTKAGITLVNPFDG